MASLTDVCTVSHVQAALPASGAILGVELRPDTVTAGIANSTMTMFGTVQPSSPYCNVTVQYNHAGRDDSVTLWYTFPAPSDFQNRFYIGGGSGYSLSTSLPTGGLTHGAVSGSTDVGYGGFTRANSLDTVVLDAAGTLNWDHIYMFSYKALGETAMVGKELSRSFYGLDDSTKVYTYFEGCSDGGREAMSQAQRYGDIYDGIIAGAPAFHHAQQQVNHVASVVTEQTMGYIAPPCEMATIANATIEACDALDGRTDGVVARSDLCRLNFDLTSLVGTPYYCPAQTSSSLGFGFSKRQAGGSQTSFQPEQNGTVSAEAVALAQRLYGGLQNSKGEQVFYGWQTASSFDDAAPQWDNGTQAWTLSAPDIGGTFITKFVETVDLDNLESLDNVTYDTLYEWMWTGYTRFYDSLQTGYADLTRLQASGGKLLHFHGESDPSVPPPSSVRYHEAVRDTMYPGSTADNATAMAEWYQFYLVPGAAHCGANDLQPGPYPQDNLQTMIEWVEAGTQPAAMNATVTAGALEGEVQQLCMWPTRPTWASNDSAAFECTFDQASYDSWVWDLNAWKIPVY